MYIPSFAYQTNVFLMCIGFGFLLGVFYHIVRFFRKSFLLFKKAVVIQDILFCIISTFGVFCFLLCCNDGEIRFFTFLGILSGFVIYYCTLGVFIGRLTDNIALFLRRFISLICQKIRFASVCIRNKLKKVKKTYKKHENKPNST